MLVHEADFENAQEFAVSLGFKVVCKLDENIGLCCSIFGGLDALVANDGFADEQSIGFGIESLIRTLPATRALPFVIALRSNSVWNCDNVPLKVTEWLNLFDVEDVEVLNLTDGRILFRGYKPDPSAMRDGTSFLKRHRGTRQPIYLGIVMPERKTRIIVNEEFRSIAVIAGVEFVSKDSSAQVVLFKPDDSLVEGLPASWAKARVLDDPQAANVLNDRVATSEIAARALQGLAKTGIAPYSSEKPRELVFPVLAKANNATMHSDIWFVGNEEALKQLPHRDFDWFYQTCIPHSGVVFKVSVIGEKCSLARRPSALDSTLPPSIGLLKLSRKGDLHPRKKKSKNVVVIEKGLPKVSVPPPVRLVEEIGLRLARAFGLSLLGIDLIVETTTNNVYVVDVNYFPSFVDVPGRERLLVDLIVDAAQSKPE